MFNKTILSDFFWEDTFVPASVVAMDSNFCVKKPPTFKTNKLQYVVSTFYKVVQFLEYSRTTSVTFICTLEVSNFQESSSCLPTRHCNMQKNKKSLLF